jgi:hypothetical protein
MPEFLSGAFSNGPVISPTEVAIRLLAALVLGLLVAMVYRGTHKGATCPASFPTTLVLLSVLIAMVTQVIGDNVARAFSLVGALSIVRFRTVVRDTQDTAYVIFAVVVGMAVGARNLWVAVIGLVVVGVAAFVLGLREKASHGGHYQLSLRVAIGVDVEQLLGKILDANLTERELLAVETARQGISLDVDFAVKLRPECTVQGLVRALSQIEGVQDVELERRGRDDF